MNEIEFLPEDFSKDLYIEGEKIVRSNPFQLDMAGLFQHQKGLKDPFINYISVDTIIELYNTLIFQTDMNFAIKMTELIYQKIKLEPQ